MRLFAPLFVALFAPLAAGAWAEAGSSQTTHKKTTASHATPTHTTATHTTAARKSTRAAKSAPRTTSARAKHTIAPRVRRTSVAHYNVPRQPSPERYKEIQQALADKGYFNGTPDGNWGPASIDALKRFQHDQNLVEDGKIGSLSLIALGLGPKRETAESAQKADPKPTQEPETKIP